MISNDSKSYLPYLNKLEDEYNNTSYHSANKKTVNGDYSAFTEKIETNSKAPKSKVNDRVRSTKHKNIFSKCYNENWSTELFIIDLDVPKWKTVPVDLIKLRDVVDYDVVKNTKFKTLKTKVNNLENKILDATTLIHINQ